METNENKSYSLEELEKIGGSDEKFVAEMIGIFINTTQQGISEIETALQKNNFTTVAGQAHKIAAPCLHMGAMKLHALLKKIESEAGNPDHNGTIETLVKNARETADQLINDLNKELAQMK